MTCCGNSHLIYWPRTDFKENTMHKYQTQVATHQKKRWWKQFCFKLTNKPPSTWSDLRSYKFKKHSIVPETELVGNYFLNVLHKTFLSFHNVRGWCQQINTSSFNLFISIYAHMFTNINNLNKKSGRTQKCPTLI